MTSRIKLLSAAVVLGVFATLLLAAVPAKASTAGHEQDELGYLVGKWTLRGDLDSHPVYGSAAVSGTMTCEWFDGHFAVVCKVEQSSKTAGVPTRALRIFAYSDEAGAYTSYGVTNTHHISSGVAMGNFQDGTWTYAGEQKAQNGAGLKFRESVSKISASSFKLTQEREVNGGWQKLAAATFTRAR